MAYGEKLYVSRMSKMILDSNFNQAVLNKISHVYEIAPNFACSQEL